MTHQDLQLPTRILLDAEGRVVKVYRDGWTSRRSSRTRRRSRPPPASASRAPCPSRGRSTAAPGPRDYVPYGRDLLDQGLEAQAVVAFEQAAQGSPSASILYRLGSLLVKTGQTAKARAAYERALALQPDLSEASNDLGTLLAESGDLPAAIERFRAALAATPDYPDALNNLGYALLLTGQGAEARELYEKALKLQPDLPGGAEQPRPHPGAAGRPGPRRALLPEGPADARRATARPRTTSPSSSSPAARPRRRSGLLQEFLEKNPASESTYLTLAKIYLASDRRREGLETIERLLQRNPTHPQALELKRQFQ